MRFQDFRRVIEFVRAEIHPELPLQQFAILLLVHEREGMSQGEISKIMKMPQATVSRNVARLASKVVEDPRTGKRKEMGYGLLENRIDPIETRQYLVFLTANGKKFMEQLGDFLANPKGG